MPYQNPSGQGAADKNRQRSELQRNITMLGSDMGKEKMKENNLKAEIRELEKDQERAKLELQKKQEELQKVEQDINTLNTSAKGLQKKLNML